MLITGTGRSGTTFLVELLTNLGLDTGYKTEELKDHKKKVGRAGLEKDIRADDSPYIVKNPWFCDYADEVFAREDILIEHIFVPIRNLNAAAQSRIHVTSTGLNQQPLWARFLMKIGLKKARFPGGIWHVDSTNKTDQEFVLLNQLYKLMLSISSSETKLTLIRYPLLTKDPVYLYNKLSPLLGTIPYETFLPVFERTVNPSIIHQFNPNDV